MYLRLPLSYLPKQSSFTSKISSVLPLYLLLNTILILSVLIRTSGRTLMSRVVDFILECVSKLLNVSKDFSLTNPQRFFSNHWLYHNDQGFIFHINCWTYFSTNWKTNLSSTSWYMNIYEFDLWIICYQVEVEGGPFIFL